MNYLELLEKVVRDIGIAVSLSTIVPVGPAAPIRDGDIASASWAFPIAGLLVGLAGALAYAIAHRIGLPVEVCAMLALAATVLLTGALHEDGLADTADGLGGGQSREQKLEIMRDSRIGTFGVCALLTSIILRWSALAAISDPSSVLLTLCAVHVAARAGLPLFMHLVRPARADGLSADAGTPPFESAVIAIGLGTLCLITAFGFGKAILGIILLSLAGLIVARLAVKQIGGQTGDIIGTFEQAGETIIVLMAAAIFQAGS